MTQKLSRLFDLLEKKKASIASAESMTGGLLASTIVNQSGASRIFAGGLVTYQKEAKVNVAGIDNNLIKEKGTISKEIAQALAKSAAKQYQVKYGIGITGNAGPNAESGREVGCCYIDICYINGEEENHYTKEYYFHGNRNSIRLTAVESALNQAIEFIKTN